MKTRTITLSPADLLVGTIDPITGIPFGWLDSLVKRIKAEVPDSEEASCRVHGVGNLQITYEHVLSESEEMRERLDALQAAVDAVRRVLPRPNEGMTADEVNALRNALG